MAETSIGSSSESQYNPFGKQSQIPTQSSNEPSYTPSHTNSSLSETNSHNRSEDGDADFRFDPLGSPVVSLCASDTEHEEIEGSLNLAPANPTQGSESETSLVSRSDEFAYIYMSSSEAWEGDDIERSYPFI